MICQECKKLGLKSKVYVGHSMTTCMAGTTYYDEDGNYHWHDPNTTSIGYNCSNGHVWSDVTRNFCPICKTAF